MRPDLKAMSTENLRLHAGGIYCFIKSDAALTSIEKSPVLIARLAEHEAIHAELAIRDRCAIDEIERNAAVDWLLRNNYNTFKLSSMKTSELAFALISWGKFWTLARAAYINKNLTGMQLIEWDRKARGADEREKQ